MALEFRRYAFWPKGEGDDGPVGILFCTDGDQRVTWIGDGEYLRTMVAAATGGLTTLEVAADKFPFRRDGWRPNAEALDALAEALREGTPIEDIAQGWDRDRQMPRA